MYVREDSFANLVRLSLYIQILKYTCRYRHVIKEQIYSTFHYLIQIVSLKIKKKERKKKKQTDISEVSHKTGIVQNSHANQAGAPDMRGLTLQNENVFHSL